MSVNSAKLTSDDDIAIASIFSEGETEAQRGPQNL